MNRTLAIAAIAALSACAATRRTVAAAWREGCPDPTELSPRAVERSGGACRPVDRFVVPAAVVGRQHLAGAWWTSAGAQLAIVTWRHPAPFPGPSHGELTIGGGYAWRDERAGRPRARLAYVEGAVRLAVERSAARRWGIPYVGAALGQILSSDVPQATYAAPLAGAHLWWSAWGGGYVALSLEAQYHVPFDEFETLRGGRVSAQLAGAWW